MKVDGNELGTRPLAVTPPGLPPPAAAERQQFERLLAKEESSALLTRWKEGTPLEALLEGHSPATRRELLWQVYQQDEKTAGVADLLFKPVASKLIERFGERQLPVVAAIDLPELRTLMREFDPLSSRRETVLLKVMAELRGQGALSGNDYLAELARRELMTLIPHNGMVNNLVRHAHKLDLEE
ncbi:YopR family type III secretion effector [Aeromonas jandaei]|uniref:YopR family T3SS polymerization control protein n=1 Tax=Aeromonas jandaei TaxID=650 RepID=UPI001933D553|nr:YopR family T3SS polymerization control protein [Aeromonas jandaei]MBM0490197.1 YopR family type III secretion effector [Aeromonas jandaei]MBM0567694.1 YopR family type III secretion effector [Aeromonas jandaei]QWL57384.1 YopR family T3SS polymerization control protein [Aeromonas jandaei]